MKPFLYLPATAPEVGVVASIPHTGIWMPTALQARLASDTMRAQPMCDWHLHSLYDFLPSLGVPVIHATVSRFVVDLNRSAEPLSLYPGRMETGVIPQETFWGECIWKKPPDELETAGLIDAWHRPYHRAVTSELERMREGFGQVVLLDLHSVASRASRIHDALTEDIYLGDRDGMSCKPGLTDAVEQCYRDVGFKVVRNSPYKGGYITHHYGQREGVDALQIEMVQRVYMEEGSPESATGSAHFVEARQRLREVFTQALSKLCSTSSRIAPNSD